MLRACSSGMNGFVGGSDSASGVTGGLMMVSSTSLGVGKGDSEGDVALLARECGRDESKELDEELVLSDGMRNLGGVPELDESAGSTMVGFAL